MSTESVRPSSGIVYVVTVSAFLHGVNTLVARLCQRCGSEWRVQMDADGVPHVTRNGHLENTAILDWTGNNVAVECCGPTD
jgi:hypothetical protein